MNKLTKTIAFLLTISTSITQANFFDTCTKWWQNTDFGPYKVPLTLCCGTLGLGYFAYRDWQISKELAELKEKIQPSQKNANPLEASTSSTPHQPLFEAINTRIQKNETRLNTLERMANNSFDDMQNLIQAMTPEENEISENCYNSLLGETYQQEENSHKALGILLKNIMIKIDSLDKKQAKVIKEQTKAKEDLNLLKAAKIAQDMDYATLTAMKENISAHMQEQLFNFPKSLETHSAKGLHVIAQSIKHIDHVATQVHLLETQLNQQKNNIIPKN